MNLENALKRGRDVLLSFPKITRIRIVSHYDADGITSAAILCKALYRKGYDFHATLLKHPFEEELTAIKEENNDIVIFSDMGSGQVGLLEDFDSQIIVIDHHQPREKPRKKNILFINSNELGIDGNYEVSGAGLSYLFAKFLDRKNVDLSYLALSGAIGDKQHLGGFTGLNRKILTEAVQNKSVKVEEARMKTRGETILEEIAGSIDPYYTELSGNEDRVKRLLHELSIESDKEYMKLNDKEKIRLHSILMLRLMKNMVQPEVLDNVIKERYVNDGIQDDLERFVDVLDACGKKGETGLALAACMDVERFYDRARSTEYEYRKFILGKLVELEKKGLKERRNFIYFEVEKASIGSYMSSIVMNYFPYKGKPVFSITRKGEEIQVSCRGTRDLVRRGLDLGSIMAKIAEKLENSNGGGHKIAAGGSFRGISLDDFLERVDKEIGEQIK